MKIAVVTGASSGIGWSVANMLANEGWLVYAVARRVERLFSFDSQSNIFPKQCDITTLDPHLFDDIARCDLLVNCAGGAFGFDSLEASDISDWLKMFHVNVLGTLQMTKIFLQRIIQANGLIINITSTAALFGYENGAGYCAAKSAERALTQSLRLEMKGVPIRITEILPGMVKTSEFSLNRFKGDAVAAENVYEGVDHPLLAEDIAQIVQSITELPKHVNIDEVIVRPVAQRGQSALYRGKLDWN